MKILFEQFSYSEIQSRFNTLRWLLSEHFKNLYPELINQYKQTENTFQNEILTVSEQFQSQLQRLLSKTGKPEDDAFLQERIKKAAVYFMEKISLIFNELLDKTIIETDNKEIQKRMNDVLGLLQTAIRQKQKTMEICLTRFTVPNYLSAKSKAAIEEETSKRKKKERASKDSQGKILVSKDILHPELYEELRAWRTMLAQERDVPVYVILSQMALLGITNTLPQTSAQLLQISGIGKATVSNYGEELLQIVQESIQEYGYEVKEPVFVHEIKSEKKQKSELNTKEQSFLLFQQGKTMEEIAQERSLAVSTIEGHLLLYVRNGSIPLEKLVTPAKIIRIKEVLQQNTEASFSEIKTILGDGYTYGEIRFVKTE
jgi:hypothetical protein